MEQPGVVFEGLRFRVVEIETISPDGTRHVRQIVEHPGSVTILPFTSDGQVCLIRNRRPGVGEDLIELPAGTREVGEEPEKTAARELAEEAGYRAGSLERLCEFWMSPGILNERMSLYLATNLAPVEQSLDPGEVIEPLLVEWEQAIAMARDGRIHDAKTLVGLLYYDRFRRSVRP